MKLQTGHLAIPGCSHLDIVNLVASMDSRCHVLTALLNPLHGMSRLHTRKGGYELFGIDTDFRPKATTNFGDDDTYPMWRETNRRSQNVTQDMRILRSTPDSNGPGGFVVICYRATCLHGNRSKSLINEARFDDNAAIGFCLSEHLFDILPRRGHAEGDICAELFIE